MPTTGEISLYFHLPFCTKKCPYCHFYVVPDRPDLKQLLLEGLLLEIDRAAPLIEGKTIASIYFGGGTPALFGPERLKIVLEKLPSAREVTLEANPADITFPLIEAYRDCGVNRLSIGVQSLHDPTLKALGRQHTQEQACQAIETAYLSGISNLTIDLMYETPGQTVASWEETLDKLASLPITHLSLYNLTIEPNTPFFRLKDTLQIPRPEEGLKMLELAVEKLPSLGLERYEISAFAKPGFESIHNTGYWTGRPFLGFGPSAFSYWEGRRYRNRADLKRYVQNLQEGDSPIDFEETLSSTAHLHERLAIALRILKGVDARDFHVDPALYARLEDQGWIERHDSMIRLSPRGLLFYDSVAEEIIL